MHFRFAQVTCHLYINLQFEQPTLDSDFDVLQVLLLLNSPVNFESVIKVLLLDPLFHGFTNKLNSV